MRIQIMQQIMGLIYVTFIKMHERRYDDNRSQNLLR